MMLLPLLFFRPGYVVLAREIHFYDRGSELKNLNIRITSPSRNASKTGIGY